MCATNHPNFGFTGIIWKYAFSARKLASSRYMRADIYAGQMWLLIILLARHLHAYGELSINYCERCLKVFFFSGNHLAFLSHVQILHAFNYSNISLAASGARRKSLSKFENCSKQGKWPAEVDQGQKLFQNVRSNIRLSHMTKTTFLGVKKGCRVAAVA